MPYRRRGSYMGRRNSSPRNIVNSIKNDVSALTGLVDGANTVQNIAIATDTATTASTTSVDNGSIIKAIWIEFWISATAEVAVGVTNAVELYLSKNPGNNLTMPIPGTQGSSNEKKFIIKGWKGLVDARTQGFQPYSWKGWVKIPKVYQRMGTDDHWQLNILMSGVAGLICEHFVYKWYK